MSCLRRDRILASAAFVLLLAAPFCALAQETAGTAGRSSASDAAASSASTSSAVAAPAQTGVPASAPNETPAHDALRGALADAAPHALLDASAGLDPTDRAIVEHMRDLLAAKPDRIFVGEDEHAAVEAFYQQRNLVPLWLDKGMENARGTAVIARLKNADADGLDPADYRTPAFAGLAPDALAEAELALTRSVLTYARHVQAGRFPYRLVRDSNIGLPQAAPDPAQVLASVAEAADAGKALDEFSPQNEPYQKLKAALAQLRGRTAGAREEIAAGPALAYNRKHPMQDARVPSLRERFALPSEASDLRYDAKLADAVKQFQRANALPATGNLDARTIRELNHPARDRRIDTVIANMERWRWYRRASAPRMWRSMSPTSRSR